VKLNINLNMTIKEAQKLVDVWIKEKGVRYFDELTNTTILMEEVGELARVISRKYGEQSIKKGEENLDLADELADVLWVLVCIANQTGVDLTDALKKNLEKKDRRDSERHLNNKKLQ
jgi:NTP pyrophosphatase (non-canonical NTP hydrolase)|tara:strand:- start:208 stop:558 length:351 start_codon:yes stop_codon:yes gene_type:complete